MCPTKKNPAGNKKQQKRDVAVRFVKLFMTTALMRSFVSVFYCQWHYCRNAEFLSNYWVSLTVDKLAVVKPLLSPGFLEYPSNDELRWLYNGFKVEIDIKSADVTEIMKRGDPFRKQRGRGQWWVMISFVRILITVHNHRI